MNPRTRTIICALSIFSYSLFGQSKPADRIVSPGGISFQYGIGSLALKDNYISEERYEGLLPYYALAWKRAHEKYLYHLSFELGQSDDIQNYNVSTHFINYRLSQGFLYPLKPLKLFQKDLGMWIGPTTDIYYCGNNPVIAISGFDYTNSYAALISLGFRSDGTCLLTKKASIASSLQFTMLSLGIRSVNSEEDEAQGTKPLTLASGLHGSFDLGVRYDLLQWLSLGIGYRFELTRVTAWENLLSTSNRAIIGAQLRF